MRTYLLAAFWTLLGVLGVLAWFAGHHWGGVLVFASLAGAKNALWPAKPGVDGRENDGVSVNWEIDV